MIRYLVFALINFQITIGSCQLSNSKDSVDLEADEVILANYLKSLGVDSVLENFILIHTEASPLCIEKLKKFVIKNDSLKNSFTASYKYIPTKIVLSGRSEKDIRSTFSESVLLSENILVDTTNKWINTKLGNEYSAVILYMDQGKLVKRVLLYPDNLERSLEDLKAWEYSKEANDLYKELHPQFQSILQSKAPQIDAVTIDGKRINLFGEKNQNNVVVLNFWIDGCAYCKVEMPILNRIYQEYKSKDVRVISIYRDDVESLSKYYGADKKYKDLDQFIEFPIISNAAEIMKNYKVNGFPLTYMIKDGNISHISNFTHRIDEVLTSNGVMSENPYYYYILKGQIDRLLASDEQ